MSREKKVKLFALLALISLVLGSLFIYWSYNSPAGFIARERSAIRLITDSETAEFTDLGGTQLSLSKYEGEILIVNAWASWSPFSKQDFEILNAIHDEFQEVPILAINRMESKELANAYLDSVGRLPNLTYIIDENDHFFDTVEGYAMPETIVYDQYGRIAFHKRGSLDREELEGVIRGLKN